MDSESLSKEPNPKHKIKWRDPFLWVGIISFVVYLVIGLSVVKSYGMSYDEPLERLTGIVNTKFVHTLFNPNSPVLNQVIFHNVPSLAEYVDRFYGSWFSRLAVGVSSLVGNHDFLREFQTMHVLVFLFSCLGILSTFAAIWIMTQSTWAATAVMLLSMSIPRFFAERFYNSKDMILLAAFELAAPWIVLSLQRFRWHWTVMAGLTVGLAIATRLSGLIAFISYLGVLGLLCMIQPRQWKKYLNTAIYFSLASGVATFLLLPFLWSRNPPARFLEAFSRFQHGFGFFQVLYNGERVSSAHLPWTYLPHWISITLPIPLIILAIVALVFFLSQFFSRHLRERILQYRAELVFLGTWLGPIVAVVLLHASLYDGWRHVYFLMAGAYMIMGSLLGILYHKINAPGRRGLMWLTSTLILFGVGTSIASIVKFHPYENVYFNMFAPRPYIAHFDVDYWGLSYREGLEYIIAHDDRSSISIRFMGHEKQAQFVENPTGKTILVAPPEVVPDYFLTNYRYHPEPYDLGVPWYSIERNGEKILDVFKLAPDTDLNKLQ